MKEAKEGITSVALENRVFQPQKERFEKAWVRSMDQYKQMYERSIRDPDGFWGEVGQDFVWFKKEYRLLNFNSALGLI